MSKLIRAANSNIQHLLAGKSEEVGDGYGHARYAPSSCRSWEVSVVNHQAYCPLHVVRPNFYTSPKLDVGIIHELSPVDAHITKKTMQHILFAAHEAA